MPKTIVEMIERRFRVKNHCLTLLCYHYVHCVCSVYILEAPNLIEIMPVTSHNILKGILCNYVLCTYSVFIVAARHP